jgi:hypothetical protein
MVYLPVGMLPTAIARVAVPDPPDVNEILVGLSDSVGPEGVTEPLSVTVPENPFRLLRVMVDVPVWPVNSVRLVGLALIEKSGCAVPVTVRTIVTE